MTKNKPNTKLEQRGKNLAAAMYTMKEKGVCPEKKKKKKKIYFFMFEELKFQPYLVKDIDLYVWFYFFDNMKLQLDSFLASYLNYAYFLLTRVNRNKSKILLIDYPFSLHKEPFDIEKKIAFLLNNAYYKNIERLVERKSKIRKKQIIETKMEDYENFASDTDEGIEQTNKEMNDEQLNIINFLNKTNIKNMMYISDIFATNQISIMFLLDSDDKQETESEEESETDKESEVTDESDIENAEIKTKWNKKETKTEINELKYNNSDNEICNGIRENYYSICKKKKKNIFNVDSRERDENGIFKGYEVILIRCSYEILYFYKAQDNERIVYKGGNNASLDECYYTSDSDEQYTKKKNTKEQIQEVPDVGWQTVVKKKKESSKWKKVNTKRKQF